MDAQVDLSSDGTRGGDFEVSSHGVLDTKNSLLKNKGLEENGVRLFDPAHLILASSAAVAHALPGLPWGVSPTVGSSDAALLKSNTTGSTTSRTLEIPISWYPGGLKIYTGNSTDTASWLDSGSIQAGEYYYSDGWIVVASNINLDAIPAGYLSEIRLKLEGKLGVDIRATISNLQNGIEITSEGL